MNNKKNYHIINHAKEQMKHRGVDINEVVDCLRSPGQILSTRGNRSIYQKQISVNGGGILLRVIAQIKEQNIEVITVYKTSKIDKYWKKGSGNESKV